MGIADGPFFLCRNMYIFVNRPNGSDDNMKNLKIDFNSPQSLLKIVRLALNICTSKASRIENAIKSVKKKKLN